MTLKQIAKRMPFGVIRQSSPDSQLARQLRRRFHNRVFVAEKRVRCISGRLRVVVSFYVQDIPTIRVVL